jgi:hypothetical protein
MPARATFGMILGETFGGTFGETFGVTCASMTTSATPDE